MKIFTPSLNPSHQGMEKFLSPCGRDRVRGLYADKFYSSYFHLVNSYWNLNH